MLHSDTRRLQSEMVPLPLHQVNLRAIMGKTADWKRLRQALLERNGHVCTLCGKEVEESSKLQAHEGWVYLERADPAVAWLWRVSLVCWHCHAVEHPGMLNALLKSGAVSERALTDTIEHYCRVNGETKRQWSAQLKRAQKEFDRRSALNWYLDYGPFAEWAFLTFEKDPLNGGEWPEHFEKRWSGDRPRPTMEVIVQAFAADPTSAIPASPRGVFAQLNEWQLASALEKRRKTLARKKREKLRAEKAQAKAARASRSANS